MRSGILLLPPLLLKLSLLPLFKLFKLPSKLLLLLLLLLPLLCVCRPIHRDSELRPRRASPRHLHLHQLPIRCPKLNFLARGFPWGNCHLHRCDNFLD